MVSWEWEEERVCCVMGGFRANWGGRGRIVEVYKWFSRGVHWGAYHCIVHRLGRLDNIGLAA